MGTYTRFVFKASLRSGIPADVFKLLCDIFNFTQKEIYFDHEVVVSAINHPFFECERWENLFYRHIDGACPVFKKTGNLWRLELDAELKDYDSEIDKFIDWITPYVHAGRKAKKYMGWKQSEHMDWQQHYWKRQEVLK